MGVKWLVFGLLAVCAAVIVLAIASSADTQATQITQQMLMLEQTKQQAAQLRAEETTRTVNLLATIIGPLVALGVVGLLLVFTDHRLTRNRVTEWQALAQLEQQRHIQLERAEQKRLEHKQQLLLEYQQRERTERGNKVIVYDYPENRDWYYEEDQSR